MYKKFFKRVFDIIVSLISIIILSPVFIICFICLLIIDGKPVLFFQPRVGEKERIFNVVKFRSMPKDTINVQSAEATNIEIKFYGKIIRRFNIDELPQLFNILKGDMSFVGPRPALITQFNLNKLRKAKNVHLQKPGLTGLAQINGFNQMSDDLKSDLDLNYCLKVNFLFDLLIILKTFKYLLKKPPIY